jgi:hypothetical protein
LKYSAKKRWEIKNNAYTSDFPSDTRIYSVNEYDPGLKGLFRCNFFL